ncbi:MAG: XTP/dITP diphosphatase [Planctomycetes bacterium]|jgi:XTP/dITP diphosphohydrolase|nr:XTP/dITP diphosphatase [Planctomycetota bacterium]
MLRSSHSGPHVPDVIVLATRNRGKIKEIRQVLQGMPIAVESLDEYPHVPEPEETGETFAENAAQKAMYYARATGKWCLADDSGLVVDALGGRPGVHSARYAAADAPPGSGREVIDAANNAKLLKALDNVADAQRTARFVCCLALSDGMQVMLETCDSVEGVIARQPSGQGGFGYDPLFHIPTLGKTTAELPPEQKNSLSHRGKALRKFQAMLHEFIASRSTGL